MLLLIKIFFYSFYLSEYIESTSLSCEDAKELKKTNLKDEFIIGIIERLNYNKQTVFNDTNFQMADYIKKDIDHIHIKPIFILSEIKGNHLSFNIEEIRNDLMFIDQHVIELIKIKFLRNIVQKNSSFIVRIKFIGEFFNQSNSFERIIPVDKREEIIIDKTDKMDILSLKKILLFFKCNASLYEFSPVIMKLNLKTHDHLEKLNYHKKIPSIPLKRIKRYSSSFDGECQLRHLRFESKEFRKYLNILEPSHLTIGYCYGKCHDYTKIKHVHTSLMVMLSFYNTNDVTGYYKLCCTSYETNSITIKHILNGITTTTSINGFSATSCVCN